MLLVLTATPNPFIEAICVKFIFIKSIFDKYGEKEIPHIKSYEKATWAES